MGESGSGKSVSSMAVLGLHDRRSAQISGSILVGGTEIVGLSEARLRPLRGNSVAMIFQDALAALHPYYKVGKQLARRPTWSTTAARRSATPAAGDRPARPGGSPQPEPRVDETRTSLRRHAAALVIALGLFNEPSCDRRRADTALDVTVEAQILDLLHDLQREFNWAVLLITHDLGVITETADDVLVMYGAGRSSTARPRSCSTPPEMPYTWGLVSNDRDGDQHYDVISAFIKSLRGSDVDAALHYLARMIEAGEDPRFIARRLVILASEDIGMADSTALQTAVAAAQAVQLIGMPEAQLNLAHATIALALAPKSNAVTAALGAATTDLKNGLIGAVPGHLRDSHYPGAANLGHGKGYKYSHDYPHGVVAQQYAPDEVVGRDYYAPSGNGTERDMAERLARLRQILRGTDG